MAVTAGWKPMNPTSMLPDWNAEKKGGPAVNLISAGSSPACSNSRFAWATKYRAPFIVGCQPRFTFIEEAGGFAAWGKPRTGMTATTTAVATRNRRRKRRLCAMNVSFAVLSAAPARAGDHRSMRPRSADRYREARDTGEPGGLSSGRAYMSDDSSTTLTSNGALDEARC